MTRIVAALRSPWTRLGGAGLVAVALVYAGVRWERSRAESAAATARAESAEREAALAGRAAAAEAQTVALERVASDLAAGVREAVAAREAVEARVRPRAVKRSFATAPAVNTPAPSVSQPPLLLPADSCATLLAAVEAERDAYAVALSAERDVSAGLRAQVEAVSAQLAERDLQLQAARTGEVKLEWRSRRRGAVIAWAVLGGFAAGVAVERL